MNPTPTPPEPTRARSRTLLGITDLTLTAAVKPGLIDAADTRSYETRLVGLLQALALLRSLSLEARALFPDTVDAIRAIQAFRLALVGEPGARRLVLAVAFDGGWEPYLRRIHRDLGPLLDVIFCNCVGYPLSTSSFATYAAWVRASQVDTEFFFHDGPLTVNDVHYLRRQAAQASCPFAGAAVPRAVPAPSLADALPALTAFFRLSDLYRPNSEDGEILRRAARFLLGDVLTALGPPGAPMPAPGPAPLTAVQQAAIAWLRLPPGGGSDGGPAAAPGAGPAEGVPPARKPAADRADPEQAQAGILSPHEGIRQGCLALLAWRDAAGAARLLGALQHAVRRHGARPPAAGDRRPNANVYVTLNGLYRAGVPPGQLDTLPAEFREGMSARASVLGDWQDNHPTRWRLPVRNWPPPAGRRAEAVPLADVDLVLHLTHPDPVHADQPFACDNPAHPLVAALRRLLDDCTDDAGDCSVEILAVQPLQRIVRDTDGQAIGHFGFADGLSQPQGRLAPDPDRPDEVPMGDLLLGFDNSLKDPPLRGRLWDAGSFVVLRQLRQDVDAFRHGLEIRDAAGAFLEAPDEQALARARLVGRRADGAPLGAGAEGTPPDGRPTAQDNRYDYAGDPDGTTCPLWSHVRRTNPRELRRTLPADLQSLPRLLRRGMSYGPPVPEGQAAGDQDRGLMFIAFVASIAEQFELIQSWIAGGNAAGADRGYSGHRDPLMGMPLPGDPSYYPYHDGQGRARYARWSAGRPPVTLQWGLYAFAPAVPALQELAAIAAEAAREEAALKARRQRRDADGAPSPTPLTDERRAAQAARLRAAGALRIQQLEALAIRDGAESAAAQWKLLLEDPGARRAGAAASVWQAVRDLHGGVLRTPFGVLVCSGARAREVLADRSGRYSVSGYAARMREAFGEIFLGRDPQDPAYARESTAVVAAIQAFDPAQAFARGLQSAEAVVRARLQGCAPGEELALEVRDLVDTVLADACRDWFGLPDGRFVQAGGWVEADADAEPRCPRHFHAPSRYFFQPRPGAVATALGQRNGQQLRRRVRAFLRVTGRDPAALEAWRRGRPMVEALCRSFPPDNDTRVWTADVARTLIGVMMGFLPTADGNLRGVIADWSASGRLFGLQRAWRDAWPTVSAAAADVQAAKAAAVLEEDLVAALQRRPVPEAVWRTATDTHRLGGATVMAGDVVVVSLASALHEAQAFADDRGGDISLLFGGSRGAPDGGPHACPGSRMAMAFMRGVLAGLLGAAELRSSPSLQELRLVA